jgi:hypothetical protein
MTKAETIEQSIQNIIDAEDHLITACVQQAKNPLDPAWKAIKASAMEELSDAWVTHLISCGLVE